MRDWNAIESDVRRDWDDRYPNNAWERFKAAVRHGWNSAVNAVDRPTMDTGKTTRPAGTRR